jgi:hypothetical protein
MRGKYGLGAGLEMIQFRITGARRNARIGDLPKTGMFFPILLWQVAPYN